MHPFNELSTKAQQENYIKEEFNLVVSLASIIVAIVIRYLI